MQLLASLVEHMRFNNINYTHKPIVHDYGSI